MIRTVSLFAGCGGLDLGFKRAGFNIIWANDNNKKIEETYKANHSNTKLVIKSIVDLEEEEIPECDVIIGGPPCQSWSYAGSGKGKEDSRGKLFYEYINIIKHKKPKAFIAENVKGILSKKHIDAFKEIILLFDRAGYKVTYEVLNAKNYSVPQDRERVFIVGILKELDIKYNFPEKINIEGNYITLREAIGDLVDNPGEYHDGSFSYIFMSRNRKRNWDEVAFTVQASGRQTQIHPDSPDMLPVGRDERIFDPESDREIRRMSVRECARLQTFPDDFEFLSSVNENYKMIGNAVPVKLAEEVAKQLKVALESKGIK
ncbi:DNA cytosine methyltransferase [Clostridioides difficile]|uniref:DNA cytosine methyltransferase n=1 Tax=Clostridioides difficile TaxID=1496 RepID=UPI0021C30D30|nr:DNA cytosine methyltransferase [Clostridioides difficile]UUC43560.1 DNA cytosine methyltransferase [Clostridioides difficile]